MRTAAVLLSIVVFLALTLAVQPTLASDRIELSWRDSGFDLAPGYRYIVSMHTECSWTHTGTEAGFRAGPLKIMATGYSVAGTLVYVTRVYVNNELVWEGAEREIPFLTAGTYDVSIDITVNHDGSGTISVEGEHVAGFSINQPYDIVVLEEEVSGPFYFIRSDVTISRSNLQPPSGSGNINLPPEETPVPDYAAALAAAINNAASVFLTLIFAGFAFIALIAFFKAMKKAKKV